MILSLTAAFAGTALLTGAWYSFRPVGTAPAAAPDVAPGDPPPLPAGWSPYAGARPEIRGWPDETILAVRGLDKHPPEVRKALLEVCERLRAPVDTVAAVLAHESGWNPGALYFRDKNDDGTPRKVPFVAAGLCQLTVAAHLEGFGDWEKVKAVAGWSAERQLREVVGPLWAKFGARVQHAHPGLGMMFNFLPDQAGGPEDRVLGEKGAPGFAGKVYSMNTGLDLNSDGKITIADVYAAAARVCRGAKGRRLRVDGSVWTPPVNRTVAPTVAPAASKVERGLLVGDSLAVGLAAPLRSRFRTAGADLDPRGINSTRIDDWSQSASLSESLSRTRPQLTLISLGTNDLTAQPADYKRALVATLVTRIRAAGSAVAWILPPSMPIADRGGTRALLAEELAKLGVPAFESEKLVLPRAPDKIHLTPAGYDLWADQIWQWLGTVRPTLTAARLAEPSKVAPGRPEGRPNSAAASSTEPPSPGASPPPSPSRTYRLSDSAGGLLLAAIRERREEPPLWVDLPWEGRGRTAGIKLVLRVSAHAVRAPLEIEGVGKRLLRLPISYQEQIEVRRLRGWLPLTQSISDAIWFAARRLDPVVLGKWGTAEEAAESSRRMRTLEWVVELNHQLDRQIPPEGWGRLWAPEGKDWILHPRIAERADGNGAVNYGLHRRDGAPWQPPGGKHDWTHFDYSQILRALDPEATDATTGKKVSLIDVLRTAGMPDAVLAPLEKGS